MAKELEGVKKVYNGVIKNLNGNKISSEHEKTKRWKEHLCRVLNCDEPTVNHDFKQQLIKPQVYLGSIRAEEVEEALSKMKSNKSPGHDLITA